MEHLDYARPQKTSKSRRVSLMAVLAIPVGLFSFPLLLNWTFESQLIMLAKAIGDSGNRLLGVVPFVWSLLGIVFCAIAWARVSNSRGLRTGAGFAVMGLSLASAWFILYAVFVSTYKSAPGSW